MPDSSAPEPTQPIALTIGNYDGVHLGHQMLIERARKHAGVGGRVLVLCFHPHPLSILAPDRAPAQIDPFEVRKARLLAAGADEVIQLAPTPELLAQDPESFLDELIDQYQPAIIVEGHDFHFGKRRTGTPELLSKHCDLRGISTDILGPVKITLTDQSLVTASSSLIRWLLEHGRVRDATYALGRPHELTGTVVQGQQLGRTINIPTINLDTKSLLPSDGVYAGIARFTHNNQAHQTLAAINVGSRPTVQGTTRRAEAHLINNDGTSWSPPADLPDYNWNCTLKLIGWVRDQVKFGSLDTLKQQIRRDCDRICEVLS
tara:strand:- start:58785 stop:59738 length:954 start_codon:yes stop_codon:yes gene_type:complete